MSSKIIVVCSMVSFKRDLECLAVSSAQCIQPAYLCVLFFAAMSWTGPSGIHASAVALVFVARGIRRVLGVVRSY